MAYDRALDARILTATKGWDGLSRRGMFGGLGYSLNGNLAFGIWGDALVVRCGPERYQDCLAEPGVCAFAATGRRMTGWVSVAQEQLGSEQELARWLELGRSFAASLPAK